MGTLAPSPTVDDGVLNDGLLEDEAPSSGHRIAMDSAHIVSRPTI